MKSSLLTFAIALSLPAAAAEQRWTDAERPAPQALRGPSHVTAPTGNVLSVFDDIEVFGTAVGGIDALALETFDGGATDAGTVGACSEPLDAASDDDCFAPGNLIEGFAVTSSLGNGVVALGEQFLGPAQASPIVGASQYAERTIVTFDPPVEAFSADVFNATVGDFTIEAFDETDASLGTATVTNSAIDEGVFVGLVSSVPMARVVVAAAGDHGELIDNLRFGNALNLGGDETLLYSNFDAPPASPAIALAFSPATVSAGQTSTLAITLTNPNPTPAALRADFVDTLPEGLAVADPSNIVTTCMDASAEAESNAITLPVGARIPVFGNCTVLVDVIAEAVGGYTNSIAAGALATSVGNNVADASADLFVVDAACDPVQLLEDPGIEATATGQSPYTNPFWGSSSTNFGTVFCDAAGCTDGGGTAGPHGGAFWAWFGGAGQPETSTMDQEVVIPAGSSRYLNFWLWIGAVGDGSSSLDVAIDNQNVATFDEPTEAEAGYTSRSADVSAFADGNSHTVTFTYTAPGALSNYSIDDVALECAPAPSMPTAPTPAKPFSQAVRRKH